MTTADILITSIIGRFPDFCPEMVAVVDACLQADPAKRLTVEQLLALPYFQKFMRSFPSLLFQIRKRMDLGR